MLPELLDTALNVLWHDQQSLYPLIRVMPPDSFAVFAVAEYDDLAGMYEDPELVIVCGCS